METDTPHRTSWLRPAIAALPTPRSPGVASDFNKPGAKPMRLLHLNESPHPASPQAIAAAQAAAAELHRYPDPLATELSAEMSRRTGVPADQIVFGAGTEDIIRLLVEVSCDRGDEILTPAPSFPLFANAARLAEAIGVRVPLAADGSNDTELTLSKVGPRTRLAFCCTPNPPNGAPTPAQEVARLAKLLPGHVMLVLDEAYREFAIHAGEPDLIPTMQERPGPWVALRTFSKAYGLAGLRIGYALCGSKAIANALRTARLAYSPSIVAQAAALGALRDEPHVARVLDAIAVERRRLTDGLTSLGLSPYRSVTNFVSVEMPFPATECVAALRARGILVRDWRDPDFPRHVRIGVGVSEDTDAVIAAMRDILSDGLSAGIS